MDLMIGHNEALMINDKVCFFWFRKDGPEWSFLITLLSEVQENGSKP